MKKILLFDERHSFVVTGSPIFGAALTALRAASQAWRGGSTHFSLRQEELSPVLRSSTYVAYAALQNAFSVNLSVNTYRNDECVFDKKYSQKINRRRTCPTR